MEFIKIRNALCETKIFWVGLATLQTPQKIGEHEDKVRDAIPNEVEKDKE
jgi:hypothetical protein